MLHTEQEQGKKKEQQERAARAERLSKLFDDPDSELEVGDRQDAAVADEKVK